MDAASDVGTLLTLIDIVKQALVYLACIILLVTKKDMDWILTLITIIGFFAIFEIFGNFYLANTILVLWLLLMMQKFLISRELMAVLLLITLVLGLQNPFFYLMLSVLHFIIVVGFLYSAFEPKGNKAGAKG